MLFRAGSVIEKDDCTGNKSLPEHREQAIPASACVARRTIADSQPEAGLRKGRRHRVPIVVAIGLDGRIENRDVVCKPVLLDRGADPLPPFGGMLQRPNAYACLPGDGTEEEC